MKTKWCIYIMWSVLSLGILSYAQGTYESPFTRRKTHFKRQQSKSVKHTADDRKLPHRLPATPSPSSVLTSAFMRPEEKLQSDFAYLQDVSVTCSTADFVLRVKPVFYGHGANAEELRLGSGCKSNGVLRPYGDLLFTYPLTACGAVRESPPGYLLYKFTLHYEPSPKRFPTRAQRIDVDIECRYQRNHHVHKLTVQPTWETPVMRKKLKGNANDFQMELMDDLWSTPALSRVYQLRKTVNFQISAPHLSTGSKLYINSCYASPSSDSKSSLKYSIIGHFGCMLDSKSDPGASRFVSRTDKTLRFSIQAFQFTADPDSEVNIHCKLLVSSEDPGPAHKSCTYKKDRWKALSGDESICDCCDSQCVPSKLQRAMMEGFSSSGSLLVSDQPYTTEDELLPVGISGVGHVTMHDTDKLHSQETPLESDDVVTYDDYDEELDYAYEEEEEEEEGFEEGSGFILGVMLDSEELGFRDRVSVESKVKDSHQLKEDGSGFVGREESEEEEEEFKGGEDETHWNQEEAEVLRHWEQLDEIFTSQVVPQRESHLPASESEEEESKHTGGGEEHERMMEERKHTGGEHERMMEERKHTGGDEEHERKRGGEEHERKHTGGGEEHERMMEERKHTGGDEEHERKRGGEEHERKHTGGGGEHERMMEERKHTGGEHERMEEESKHTGGGEEHERMMEERKHTGGEHERMEEESKHTGRGEEHERMMEERKHTSGGEEHERMMEWEEDDSLEDFVDDGESTWYFPWR
ncbi:hypothetical protein CgunFtcFv8_011542 [Champsocephalus gunnari]|uniref:Zona pellucida sperm-binding protein 3 n=1 Tax=Champsocephalus gunnari TaxID=52237 RepID=A0AAN8D4U2_CHAGU|nr:hypothetical protein CgunFtcFv8_011542 [Champsocephalus gunnari]